MVICLKNFKNYKKFVFKVYILCCQINTLDESIAKYSEYTPILFDIQTSIQKNENKKRT